MTPCTELTGEGKVRGKHTEPVSCFFQDSPLEGNFTKLLDGIAHRVMHSRHVLYPSRKRPSDQALRNLRGSWFQTIVAVVCWNTFVEANKSGSPKIAIVQLPSANVMQWWELFDDEAQERLRSGLFASLEAKGIKMTLPNPDFICIAGQPEQVTHMSGTRIDHVGLSDMKRLKEAYQYFKGRCNYKSLKFGLSVKHEIKPDRRYLIVYEASLVKAVVSHLQARYWDKSFAMKYLGLVHKPLSKPDWEVYRNPSIDSITDVHAVPRKAVDEMVQCMSIEQAKKNIRRWITES